VIRGARRETVGRPTNFGEPPEPEKSERGRRTTSLVEPLLGQRLRGGSRSPRKFDGDRSDAPQVQKKQPQRTAGAARARLEDGATSRLSRPANGIIRRAVCC
jgi:hypothetical protein